VDLLDEKHLRDRLRSVLAEKNEYLSAMLDESALAYDSMADDLVAAARVLREHIRDTSRYLCEALTAGSKVLFEGAQGLMLDVDLGTYPFVTSSNTGSGAVCSGAGVPPKLIRHVVGISKAYTTRVGSGPFPTELEDETGERLRAEGGEFGATTGRPRRCGWFDAVVVRRGARISGVDSIALTKLDVLTGFPTIRVCVGYRLDGAAIDDLPALAEDLDRVEPVYEELPGWDEDLTGARSIEDLPANARAYIGRLSELIGVSVGIVSVGPARDETIKVSDPFAA
jgi:adenylosuccinate synthase